MRDFTIDFYPSIAVGSEPDVAKGPLMHFEVGGNAGETPAEMVGDVQTYDYHTPCRTPSRPLRLRPTGSRSRRCQSGDPDWALSQGTRGDCGSTSGAFWATAQRLPVLLPAMWLSTCWRRALRRRARRGDPAT